MLDVLLTLAFFLLPYGGAYETRIDCHPDRNATKKKCEARGCIWASPYEEEETTPWCYLKPGIGYVAGSTSGSVMTLKKNKGPKNPWGPDMQEIKFKTENIGKTLNVKIYVDGRYEPPLDLPRQPTKSNDTLEVKTAHSKQTDTFYFLVKRKSSQRAIFDTSIGGLIFSDKFLQIATYLPSNALYGFGENSHQSLQHDFSRYTTWGMFARDEHPHYSGLNTNNLYGVHPFYMIMEPDGCAHGVFIHNTNAQEITTAPGPALIYRTIGGNIDLFFFPGPTPEEVIQQYLALIGKPVMPAYWALGFQLSRWMYNDLFEMKRIVARNMQAGIPLETVVADIDYMDRYKDFTVGPKYEGLGEYVKQLHSWNMRSILIYDPAIQVDYGTFERGIKSGARFIEWERKDQVDQSIQNLYNLTKGTKIMLAVVWPDRHTAYPDFLDPTNATQKWWIDETVRFHKEVPSDGIWIDMNEPTSFGTNEDNPWYYADLDHPDPKPLRCPTKGTDAVWDKPPYETHNVYNYGKSSTLAEKTVCMLGLQANGTQRVYNVKSIYGWSQAKATLPAQHAMTGKRGLVISRSTFASAGRYSGHWLGDNSATWLDLEASVIGAQEFNMFGMPYVGSDICGFNGDTTEELCLRWHQIGAFHPFMRNHNTKGSLPQDPARWTTVTKATIKATLFRYKYLPFLYSLHFAASMHGGTVIRPVFFEFPHDHATYNLGYQFMWGKSMLIAPVVKGGTKSVRVYLPNGAWYSLYDYNYGEWILAGWQEFPAPTTSLIPVFARGGSILPRQAPNTTTAVSRQNPFELLIAPTEKGTAKGFLYWDDGESIIHSYDTYKYCHWEFKYKVDKNGATLTIHTKRSCDSSLKPPTLDIMEIFNYKFKPILPSFVVNGNRVNVDRSSYDEVKNILHIHSKNLINLSAGGTIDLSWKHSKTDDTKTIHHGGTLTQHTVTPRQKPPTDLERNDLRSTIIVKDLPQRTGTQMDPNDVRPTTTVNDLSQGTGTQMDPNDVRSNATISMTQNSCRYFSTFLSIQLSILWSHLV